MRTKEASTPRSPSRWSSCCCSASPSTRPTEQTREISGGLLWIVFAFAGTLVLNRSFARELPNDCLDALIAAPISGAALFLGKALANFVLLLARGGGLAAGLRHLLQRALDAQFWPLMLVLALGTWGLTVIGTMFSALTVNMRLREVMLPMLVYPIMIPALMAAMQLTTHLIGGPAARRRYAGLAAPAGRLRRHLHGAVADPDGNRSGGLERTMREKLLYVLCGLRPPLLFARNLYVHASCSFPDEASAGRHLPHHLLPRAGGHDGVPVLLRGAACASVGLPGDEEPHASTRVAVSVTEVGLAFGAANLITGMIWGRIIWGIWWTWDRAAHLDAGLLAALRRLPDAAARHRGAHAARHASRRCFSIFAFIDVPIVFFSIKWWRTQHPQPVFWGGGAMDSGVLVHDCSAELGADAAARHRADRDPAAAGRSAAGNRRAAPRTRTRSVSRGMLT